MISIGIGAVLIILFFAQCTLPSTFADDEFLANFEEPIKSALTEREDLTIVCTVDGIVHGIDKYGSKVWSTSTGKPMLSAQNYAAYDSVTDLKQEQDEFSTTGQYRQSGEIDKRKGYSILPSTDGTLIYHSIEGMRKTSVTARLLVEQTPFVSGEGISFTGKKSSRLIKIDAGSGAILFDTEDNNGVEREIPAMIDPNSSPIWIGRIDYALEAMDTTTGLQEFNFTYSELIPLPYGSQYQYGVPQEGRQQTQDRGQESSEDFEVATDVQLEEAEVAGLLGARVAAGWNVEDSDEFVYTQESHLVVESDVDKALESKTVSFDPDDDASPRSRVGKVKRKRGRRRRKSRVSMEKRAAATTKSDVVEVTNRQLEPLDGSVSALISTPDGELYFSDGDGTVVEKTSLHLHSPVFSAFKLYRILEDNVAAVPVSDRALPLPANVGGNGGRWGVQSINVQHRVLTYPMSADATAALTEQRGLAVAGGDVRPLDVKKIIVQSPFSTDKDQDDTQGHLFVLEVSELEMPGLRPNFADRDEEIAHPGVPMLQSPYPTKRELREKAKESRQRESPDAVARHKNQPQEKEFPRKHLIRPGAPIASSGLGRRPLSTVQRRGKGLHGPAKLRLLDTEDGDHRLPDGQSLNLEGLEIGSQEGTFEVELVKTVEDVCAMRTPKFYFPVSWLQEANQTTLNTCPRLSRRTINTTPPKKMHSDSVENSRDVKADALLKKRGHKLSGNSGMRGSHMLRPDLYEGTLFRSDPAMLGLDAQMHFFRGMLASGQNAQKRSAATEQSWDGWRDSFHGETSSSSVPKLPVISKSNHREWLDVFALRVFVLVEHLLLNLIAVTIVLTLVFVLCVYFLRTSPTYAHILPVNIGFSGQLQFAFHALVGKALERLTVMQVNTPKSRPPLPSLSVPTSPAPHMIMQTQDSSPAQLSVVFPVKEEPFAPSVVGPVIVGLTGAVHSAPSSLHPVVEETVDTEGKRLLRVGALLVHCDHILGYGSHGTTVYRGSLDGRPLAVKRILNQFVRSADREISLLIRSDGHANVVRYFTKEQKSDFVYLGLQLCDMTLKDFVVQVRSKSEVADSQISISEIVKTGLLQIAMGVAHLHAQRIVHRDIKPQNILLAQLDDCAIGNCSTGNEEYVAHSSPASMDDLSTYVLKISDMGLSKQLGRDHHSFSSMSLSVAKGHSSAPFDPIGMGPDLVGTSEELARSLAVQAAVGTVGWQAPELISHRYNPQDVPSPVSESISIESGKHTLSSEDVVLIQQQDDGADSDASGDDDRTPTVSASTVSVLKQLRKERKKRTLTVDVFSLGCVFYFTITRGEHPFGQWFEREANIAAGKMNLDLVKHDPLAFDLLTWMLTADPLLRPTSSEVCGHPFFWTATSKLNFLVEFSDRMEHEPADSSVVLAVEAGSVAVLGSRWDRRLDVLLLEDLGKFRKYDTSSVRDLLRVIRNKRHHFHELSVSLKEAIGSVPDNFMAYFDARFPRLVLHCAYVAHRYLSDEALFRPWVRGTRSCGASPTVTLLSSESESHIQHIRECDIQRDLSNSLPVVVNNERGKSTKSAEDKSFDNDHQLVDSVVVWQSSALANTLQCGGWWRHASDWVTAGTDSGVVKKNRASHLTKSSCDPKYRISLCTHWEDTLAVACPMRKKGKCVFAHGPLELRVKESRRSKWGQTNSTCDLFFSGGEDVFGTARNTLRSRQGLAPDAARGRNAELSAEGLQSSHVTGEAPPAKHNGNNSGKDSPLSAPDRLVRPSLDHQVPYNRRQMHQQPFVSSPHYNHQTYPYPQGAYLQQHYMAQQQRGYFEQPVVFGEYDASSESFGNDDNHSLQNANQQYNRYPPS